MSATNAEILARGMKCLTREMGIVEAEPIPGGNGNISTPRRRRKSAGKRPSTKRRIPFRETPSDCDIEDNYELV